MQPTRKRGLIDAAAVLLGFLTLLTAPNVQSQDSLCSNYWINPQTGKKECLNRSLSNPGNALSGRQFHRLRRQLNQHYTMGRVRVFYNTSGKHAVDPADSNQNRIPDQVEDVAKQTWAAYKLFVETLNFPDPLKSKRYRQASWIDVNLLAKATINRNGVASYQELGYSGWLEKNQKSQRNNAYIYQAIMDTARQRGHAVSSFRANQ